MENGRGKGEGERERREEEGERERERRERRKSKRERYIVSDDTATLAMHRSKHHAEWFRLWIFILPKMLVYWRVCVRDDHRATWTARPQLEPSGIYTSEGQRETEREGERERERDRETQREEKEEGREGETHRELTGTL